MKQLSLSARLFLASAIVIFPVLGVAGWYLGEDYRSIEQRSFKRELSILFSSLAMGVNRYSIDFDVGNPQLSHYAPELFSEVYSGWYWQLRRVSDHGSERESAILTSESLWNFRLQTAEAGDRLDSDDLQDRHFYRQEGPLGKAILTRQQIVLLKSGKRVELSVAANLETIETAIERHNQTLLLTLTLLGVSLVSLIWLHVRIGLRPLNRLRNALSRIRQGEVEWIDEPYPADLTPVVRQLNDTLEENRKIVERARTHAGNLAHALRTPLSVVQNVVTRQTGADYQQIGTQVALMKAHVQHHLNRARAAARSDNSQAPVHCRPVIDGLVGTLCQLYRERNVRLDVVEAQPDLSFRGERRDLEEMLGNLLENAFKWTKSRIHIGIRYRKRNAQRDLVIEIDDDGEGLAPNAQTAVLARGKRLDETTPGSGLGLSIVLDLAQSYQGNLELDRADIGGTRARLTLPSAPRLA